MLPHLLFAVAALLLLASRAEASPINILLTVNYGAPTEGPPGMGHHFEIFESDSNDWLNFARDTRPLAYSNTLLFPGETQYSILLDVGSLDNVYFFSEWVASGDPFPNVLMASPPGGFSDVLAAAYGPPWIPLVNMGDGFSGNYQLILGFRQGRTAAYSLSVQNDMAPVPEPATMLLLGSGLAAVMARRYRQPKPRRPVS